MLCRNHWSVLAAWRRLGEVVAFCSHHAGHILFLRRAPKLPQATVSFVVSASPSAWNSSAPTGQIFMMFEYFFEILWRKFFSDGTTAQFNTVVMLIHISQLAIFVGRPFQCLILHVLICVFAVPPGKNQVSVKSGKNNGYFA